jgi:hypothetical protein
MELHSTTEERGFQRMKEMVLNLYPANVENWASS